jgi:VanZ family protein
MLMFTRRRRWLIFNCSGTNPIVVLLVLWGSFIVYGTLLPFRFTASLEHVAAGIQGIWANPWPTMSRADFVSNVLLFMPWGFLLAAWQAERGATYLAAAIFALLTGLLLSAGVETAQLFAPSRTTSLHDLLSNATGSMLGALVGWPFAGRVWPRLAKRVRQLAAERPLMACAMAVAAGLTITALSPFDVSIQASDLKAAIKNARLFPFGPTLGGSEAPVKPWFWAVELLTWTLAGALFALATREAGRRGIQAILCVAIAGGSLCLVTELLQIVVPSRQIDMSTVVVALAGSTAGAALVVRAGSLDARHWIAPALYVWGALAILTYWTPPNFAWPATAFFGPERLVPFWSYYVRTDAAARYRVATIE